MVLWKPRGAKYYVDSLELPLNCQAIRTSLIVVVERDDPNADA
jgi:hypothetical protein